MSKVAGFSLAACRRHTAEALSAPPARPHIVRTDPVGAPVARFFLPLELCPTLNAFAEWPSWRRAKVKKAALEMMLVQNGLRRRSKPLPGRPQVRAVRFSSVEPDSDAGWCKVPVDRLTGKKGGLGFLEDDRPGAVSRSAWWEPAKPGAGFVLLEVWTGA